ncbi:MAG: phosphatidate cytidylyltransferase [Armatimonadota bacterium]
MPRNFDEARQRLEEARERARVAAHEAHDRVREAQDRAVGIAREAASEAQERARAVTDAMPPGLVVRLVSSFVGIPLLLVLVFFEVDARLPGILFASALALVALLGAGEYFRALRLRHFRPSSVVGYLAIAILQIAAFGSGQGILSELLPMFLAVMVITTLVHQVVRRESEPLANTGVTFLGVVYVGWMVSYLIRLRSFPGMVAPAPFPETPKGAWVVLYVFAVTWITDTGAYFTGSRFGKRKLAPRLSPNKTVEGAVGGLCFATLMSVGWGTWIGLPLWHCALLGPILGLLGQIGDLCESALKRDLGIKDFGGIMPGHGGILDRFDSLLFTAPIAYYYLSVVLRGHL